MDANKEEFRKLLEKARVREAAEKLNLDFEKIFLNYSKDLTKNPYMDYRWTVMPHSLDGLLHGFLIHSVPIGKDTEKFPWEEWFVYKGEKRHHILFTKKKDRIDGEFDGDIKDTDHPREVLGKKWFYYNDTDLTPYLLR